jgi:AcrR family transcriptional regulator
MDDQKRRIMDPAGKRAAALAAAEAIFASEGYANATMAAIAKSADIAVGSLYRLFPDKAALLAALHRRMEQHVIHVMVAAWADGTTPYDAYAKLAEAIMTAVRDALPIMPLYTMTRDLVGTTDYLPGKATVQAIAGLYTQGSARGDLKPLDPAFAAAVAYGMVDGVMRMWMANPTDALWEQAVATLSKTMADCFVLTG